MWGMRKTCPKENISLSKTHTSENWAASFYNIYDKKGYRSKLQTNTAESLRKPWCSYQNANSKCKMYWMSELLSHEAGSRASERFLTRYSADPVC